MNEPNQIKPSVYFALMAEFQSAYVPIETVGRKYWGHSEPVAKRKAADNDYPFPVIKMPGQKSPWLVDIRHLAEYLEKLAEPFRAKK